MGVVFDLSYGVEFIDISGVNSDVSVGQTVPIFAILCYMFVLIILENILCYHRYF